jgi:hypothetical protein
VHWPPSLEKVRRAEETQMSRRFLSVQTRRRWVRKDAMNITKNLGMLLLAIYLILAGVTLLFHITIPAIFMGLLALAAGILILIGK